MKKKTYINPGVELIAMSGECILGKDFSEDPNAQEKNDIELDANQSGFFEDITTDKSNLWDD